MKISIIQPFIADYREDFYKKLSELLEFDIFCVEKPSTKEAFNESISIQVNWLKTLKLGKFKLFNFLNKKLLSNEIIVTNFNPSWISLYLLIGTKIFLRKKIVLWTHGTSVLNGFNPNTLRDKVKLKIFNIVDGICFYTKNEYDLMSPYLYKPKLFFLNNTLNVEKINNLKKNVSLSKSQIKEKYGISSKKIIIFCARFIDHRREDLLVDLIKILKNDDVAFIIIGDGENKPDFSNFTNVFDFGSVYDVNIKSELFSISDLNFQPAWSGLSVVESLANEVPFITMKKSNDIPQCVEYSYIKHSKNGFLLKNIYEVKDLISSINDEELNSIKSFCGEYALKELSLDKMVKNFYNCIETVNKSH